MQKPAAVNIRARGLPDDTVVFIDDVEKLVGILSLD